MAIEALNPNKLFSNERFAQKNKERSPIKDGLEVAGKITEYMFRRAIEDLHQVISLTKDAVFPDTTKTPFENAVRVLTDASVPPSMQRKVVEIWEKRIKS